MPQRGASCGTGAGNSRVDHLAQRHIDRPVAQAVPQRGVALQDHILEPLGPEGAVASFFPRPCAVEIGGELQLKPTHEPTDISHVIGHRLAVRIVRTQPRFGTGVEAVVTGGDLRGREPFRGGVTDDVEMVLVVDSFRSRVTLPVLVAVMDIG